MELWLADHWRWDQEEGKEVCRPVGITNVLSLLQVPHFDNIVLPHFDNFDNYLILTI